MTRNGLDTMFYVKEHRNSLTHEQLMEIYENFGGFAALSGEIDHYSSEGEVREGLMRATNFPEEEWRRLFETFKIDKYFLRRVGLPLWAINDPELFAWAWKLDKTAAAKAVYNTAADHGKIDGSGIHFGFHNPAPDIHVECDGKAPGVGWHDKCHTNRVSYDSVARLASFREARRWAFEKIDREVIERVQELGLNGSIENREAYAESVLVRGDHWDTLAEDKKRSVLNNVVMNPLAPEELRAERARHHKTPELRQAAAFATVDLELLHWIWSNSKSHSIRRSVLDNDVWDGGA